MKQTLTQVSSCETTWQLSTTHELLEGVANEQASIQSSQFSMLGLEWQLEAVPYVINGLANTEFAQIHLRLRTRLAKLKASVVIQLLHKDSSGAEEKDEHDYMFMGARHPGRRKLPGDLFRATDVVFSTARKPRPAGSCTKQTLQMPRSTFAAATKGGVLSLSVKLTSAASTFDAAVPPSTILADLRSMLESGVGADVTLVCQGTRIKAHSLVLCARSPMLRAQLSGPLASGSMDDVSVDKDIVEPVLRQVLTFMYTDELSPASAEEAQHLLHAAHYYQLPRLRGICEAMLALSLTNESVAYTLSLAEVYEADALKEAAFHFIKGARSGVMQTAGWADMARNQPQLKDQLLAFLLDGDSAVMPKRSGGGAAAAGGAAGAASADGGREQRDSSRQSHKRRKVVSSDTD